MQTIPQTVRRLFGISLGFVPRNWSSIEIGVRRIVAERDAATAEKNSTIVERDALAREISTQRDTIVDLQAQLDAVTAERDSLQAQLDALRGK